MSKQEKELKQTGIQTAWIPLELNPEIQNLLQKMVVDNGGDVDSSLLPHIIVYQGENALSLAQVHAILLSQIEKDSSVQTTNLRGVAASPITPDGSVAAISFKINKGTDFNPDTLLPLIEKANKEIMAGGATHTIPVQIIHQ
jgi:hypothetical protein